jgi:ankyrin repeat protein
MLTLQEVLNDFADSIYWSSAEKVEVNSRGVEGKSPLHFMAYFGDANAIFLLVEAGADINTIDDEGCTPLHEAMFSRQAFAASALIGLSAILNCKNKLGKTPLDIAKDDAYEPCIALFE